MINATTTNTTSGMQAAAPQPVMPQSPQSAPSPTPSVGGIGGSTNFKPVGPKKIFGIDVRTFSTVLGLTAFFLVAMLGVTAALRQRINPAPVAPNAPASKPAAFVESPANCTLRFSALNPSPSPTPVPTATPVPSTSPTPSPTATPTTTYACGSPCTTDAQCQTANAQYVCSNAHGNTCRLDSNRDSASCQPPANQYACNSTCTTDAQCQTANSAYVCHSGNCRLNSNLTASNCQPTVIVSPPPVVGCNQPCSTNADCSNSSHICYTTPDGTNRCRLDNYPNSESCTTPSVIYTPTTTTQPQLPAELPKTGMEDWGKWLGAGLATLGIGALLLLLI